MRRVLSLALSLATLAWPLAAGAQEPPASAIPAQPVPAPEPAAPLCTIKGLFRATIRNISPGLPASHLDAQPRTLWRFGTTFLRSLQQPDPVHGSQMLTIVAEPEIWAINLATGVGQHSLDPGPDFTVHAPILPVGPGMPPQLLALQYGCEPEFVARHAPQAQQRVKWGEIPATLHTAVFGEHVVVALMDQRRKEPIMISYLRQGRPVYVVRYDDWRNGLPNRPEIFLPPANVQIREAPQQTPGAAPEEGAEPPLIPLDKGGRTPFSD